MLKRVNCTGVSGGTQVVVTTFTGQLTRLPRFHEAESINPWQINSVTFFRSVKTGRPTSRFRSQCRPFVPKYMCNSKWSAHGR